MAAYDNVRLAGAPSAADYNAGFNNFLQVGNQVAELPDSYYKGTQMGRSRQLQTMFQDGLPKDAQGQPDITAMSDKLIRSGGADYAKELLPFLWKQQFLAKGGQNDDADLYDARPGPQPPQQQPIPMSPHGAGPANLQPPQGQPQQPQGAPGGPPGGSPGGAGPFSIQAEAQKYGIPDHVVERISQAVGYGPMDPISDPGHVERVRNIIQQVGANQLTAAQPPEQPGAGGAPPAGGGYTTAEPSSAASGLVPSSYQGREREYADVLERRANQLLQKARQEEIALGKGAGAADTERAKSYLTKRDEVLKAISGAAGKQFEGDNKRFDDQYKTYDAQGQAADFIKDKVELGLSLTNDPKFYSGAPFPEFVNRMKAAGANLGGLDPNAALRPELFKKVVSDMLTQQIKGMGQSGVGRVLQSEVNIMRDGIATIQNTPVSNRAQLEIYRRVTELQSKLGQMARDYKGGHLDAGFDKQASAYIRSHQLFTEQEKAHPELLGAPRMRAGIDRPGDEQAVWGLKKGDPYFTPKGLPRWVE